MSQKDNFQIHLWLDEKENFIRQMMSDGLPVAEVRRELESIRHNIDESALEIRAAGAPVCASQRFHMLSTEVAKYESKHGSQSGEHSQGSSHSHVSGEHKSQGMTTEFSSYMSNSEVVTNQRMMSSISGQQSDQNMLPTSKLEAIQMLNTSTGGSGQSSSQGGISSVESESGPHVHIPPCSTVAHGQHDTQFHNENESAQSYRSSRGQTYGRSQPSVRHTGSVESEKGKLNMSMEEMLEMQNEQQFVREMLSNFESKHSHLFHSQGIGGTSGTQSVSKAVSPVQRGSRRDAMSSERMAQELNEDMQSGSRTASSDNLEYLSGKTSDRYSQGRAGRRMSLPTTRRPKLQKPMLEQLPSTSRMSGQSAIRSGQQAIERQSEAMVSGRLQRSPIRKEDLEITEPDIIDDGMATSGSSRYQVSEEQRLRNQKLTNSQLSNIGSPSQSLRSAHGTLPMARKHKISLRGQKGMSQFREMNDLSMQRSGSRQKSSKYLQSSLPRRRTSVDTQFNNLQEDIYGLSSQDMSEQRMRSGRSSQSRYGRRSSSSGLEALQTASRNMGQFGTESEEEEDYTVPISQRRGSLSLMGMRGRMSDQQRMGRSDAWSMQSKRSGLRLGKDAQRRSLRKPASYSARSNLLEGSTSDFSNLGMREKRIRSGRTSPSSYARDSSASSGLEALQTASKIMGQSGSRSQETGYDVPISQRYQMSSPIKSAFTTGHQYDTGQSEKQRYRKPKQIRNFSTLPNLDGAVNSPGEDMSQSQRQSSPALEDISGVSSQDMSKQRMRSGRSSLSRYVRRSSSSSGLEALQTASRNMGQLEAGSQADYYVPISQRRRSLSSMGKRGGMSDQVQQRMNRMNARSMQSKGSGPGWGKDAQTRSLRRPVSSSAGSNFLKGSKSDFSNLGMRDKRMRSGRSSPSSYGRDTSASSGLEAFQTASNMMGQSGTRSQKSSYDRPNIQRRRSLSPMGKTGWMSDQVKQRMSRRDAWSMQNRGSGRESDEYLQTRVPRRRALTDIRSKHLQKDISGLSRKKMSEQRMRSGRASLSRYGRPSSSSSGLEAFQMASRNKGQFGTGSQEAGYDDSPISQSRRSHSPMGKTGWISDQVKQRMNRRNAWSMRSKSSGLGWGKDAQTRSLRRPVSSSAESNFLKGSTSDFSNLGMREKRMRPGRSSPSAYGQSSSTSSGLESLQTDSNIIGQSGTRFQQTGYDVPISQRNGMSSPSSALTSGQYSFGQMSRQQSLQGQHLASNRMSRSNISPLPTTTRAASPARSQTGSANQALLEQSVQQYSGHNTSCSLPGCRINRLNSPIISRSTSLTRGDQNMGRLHSMSRLRRGSGSRSALSRSLVPRSLAPDSPVYLWSLSRRQQASDSKYGRTTGGMTGFDSTDISSLGSSYGQLGTPSTFDQSDSIINQSLSNYGHLGSLLSSRQSGSATLQEQYVLLWVHRERLLNAYVTEDMSPEELSETQRQALLDIHAPFCTCDDCRRHGVNGSQ